MKSSLAGFVARAVTDELITLKEAAEPLEGGQHYPLFLLCLQHLHKSMGQTWLHEHYVESKINLMSMLPEIDRNKERLAAILEDRTLGFLYPMLRVESEMWKQICQPDCTPSALYRWLKDNVDASLLQTNEFINVLFICLLKHITGMIATKQQSQTETGETVLRSPNGTSVADFEREILSKFQPVLQAFLHERSSLQLTALYSLQSYCYQLEFPKGNSIS